ncbi:hypothetical protein CH370_00005, partial [Leptospira kmetyi]
FSKVGTKLNKSSGFRVSTPTSTAAVRGTDFQVEVEGNKTETLVSDGSVEVTDNDNPDQTNTAAVEVGVLTLNPEDLFSFVPTLEKIFPLFKLISE